MDERLNRVHPLLHPVPFVDALHDGELQARRQHVGALLFHTAIFVAWSVDRELRRRGVNPNVDLSKILTRCLLTQYVANTHTHTQSPETNTVYCTTKCTEKQGIQHANGPLSSLGYVDTKPQYTAPPQELFLPYPAVLPTRE